MNQKKFTELYANAIKNEDKEMLDFLEGVSLEINQQNEKNKILSSLLKATQTSYQKDLGRIESFYDMAVRHPESALQIFLALKNEEELEEDEL